jgi:hypothetical protein
MEIKNRLVKQKVVLTGWLSSDNNPHWGPDGKLLGVRDNLIFSDETPCAITVTWAENHDPQFGEDADPEGD